MMGPPMIFALLLGALLSGLAPERGAEPPPSPTPANGAEASARREAFLKRAEAAFAAREAKGLESLADVDAWRAAGWPDPSTLRLFLPPAPVVFEKALTPLESVWRDGSGRRWRLVLTEAKGEPRAVIRASPCPRGIVTAPGVGRPERSATPVTTWSILECWPLPR